jgi:hypothetical protein
MCQGQARDVLRTAVQRTVRAAVAVAGEELVESEGAADLPARGRGRLGCLCRDAMKLL